MILPLEFKPGRTGKCKHAHREPWGERLHGIKKTVRVMMSNNERRISFEIEHGIHLFYAHLSITFTTQETFKLDICYVLQLAVQPSYSVLDYL